MAALHYTDIASARTVRPAAEGSLAAGRAWAASAPARSVRLLAPRRTRSEHSALAASAPARSVRLLAPRRTRSEHSALAASAPARSVRLPEGVYRRRRVVVAAVAAVVVTLVLAVGRPDSVPPGEANPWPSVAAVPLPAESSSVYVVQPGDTLWGIARSVAPGADRRSVVHELAETAGGASLDPGQRLVINGDAELSATGEAVLQSGQRPVGDRAPLGAT